MGNEETSNMEGSLYATPFVLAKDTRNNHKVDPLLPKSMEQSSGIPFLRSKIDSMMIKDGQTGGFDDYAIPSQPGRIRGLSNHKVRRIRTLNRKEQGWNSYVKPISKYNE